jgi:hypothetical protein
MSREALLSPPAISTVPLWRLLFLGAGAAQDGREGFRGAKENTGQRQTGAGGLLRGAEAQGQPAMQGFPVDHIASLTAGAMGSRDHSASG